MTNDEILKRLNMMLTIAQELASVKDPALDGDIQIVLAIITDKLRYMDPLGILTHQIEN